MGDFLTNASATLPTNKAEWAARTEVPAEKKIVHGEWNTLAQSVLDLREGLAGSVNAAAFLQAPWISGGYTPGTTDARPALAAALATGKHVLIPHIAGGWRISDWLTVSTPGQRVMGERTTIKQSTQGRGVFDISGANCMVRGIRAENETARVYIASGSWRGVAPYLENCAFFAWANGVRVIDCEASGFVSGVNVSGWDGTGNTAKYTDMVVDGFLFDGDFGVLTSSFGRLKIDNLRGTYSQTPSSGNPPHLLYISGDVGPGASDLLIGRCDAWGGRDGHAYQLKGVTGGLVGGLYATDCTGILSHSDSSDVTYGEVVTRGDLGYLGAGSVYMFNTCTRTVFGTLRINMAAVTERCMRVASDTEIGHLIAYPNRSAEATDVVFSSTSATWVHEMRIRNLGAGGIGTHDAGANVTFGHTPRLA